MKRQGGFTLVEVLVIAPVLMLTIIFMTTFLFNQYGQLIIQGAQINLQTEAQNIVFSMQDDIFFANSFEQTIEAGLSDPYQPGGGWTYNSTPQRLIVSTPAYTTNRRSENRQPVYINTEGCTSDVIQENTAAMNNIVYFSSGTNLYKRTITLPSSTPTCGTNYVKQNCPAANATTSCPADRVLSSNLKSITYTYYDANNVQVTNPNLADRVKIDITLEDKAFAETISSSSSITLKRFN